MLREAIQQQINVFLNARPDVFLVEFKMSPQNEVELIIDGDEGISVDDCLQLSRQVENNVDREDEDYALKVSSYGISNPLINERQFKKNVGRKIKLTTEEGEKYKGTLSQADDNGVTVTWKERVPKEVGKGKVTKEFNETIAYNNIKQAKIVISF